MLSSDKIITLLKESVLFTSKCFSIYWCTSSIHWMNIFSRYRYYSSFYNRKIINNLKNRVYKCCQLLVLSNLKNISKNSLLMCLPSFRQNFLLEIYRFNQDKNKNTQVWSIATNIYKKMWLPIVGHWNSLLFVLYCIIISLNHF